MTSTAILPEPIRGWAEAHVGPIRAVEDRSWGHGVSQVWRVSAPDGPVWVKRHAQLRKYEQEARAYARVVPRLAEAGVDVPVCIAADPTLRTLLLTEVPGDPAPEHAPEVHRQAGEAARVLHGIPDVDDVPVPIVEALRARYRQWADEGAGLVEPGLLDAVGDALDPAAFVGARRVWCHRDWSPRNWLVTPRGFGTLDFEHCAPDLWLLDLVKLADGIWRRHPATREAFLAGYRGRPLDATEEDQLRRVLFLHALGTTVWGATHGDPAYERHGRDLLAELARGP